MPGLVFGTETLLWLFIVFPDWTQQQIFPRISEKNGLGFVLGGVLMSGALGYIFATIHHVVHHYFNLKIDRGILDHSRLINRLIVEKAIPVEPNSGVVNREEALAISTMIWCRLKDKGHFDGDATYKKFEYYGDQTHALGAARIASVFAFVTALMFCFTIGTPNITCGSSTRFVLMLALGGGVICIFHYAYRYLGTFAQDVYDRIVCEAYKGKGTERKEG